MEKMENINRETYRGDIEGKLKERIIDERENTFPQDVVIETTGFCNLNCPMCANDKMTRKKTHMRWPLYIKLIEEVSERAGDIARVWLCFAGEPLIGNDFADRVFFAKSKGIKNLVTNSNMTLMTKEKAEEIVKSGLNNIFVGLDATTAEIYSQIRRGGNFEQTVQNVLYYKDALDKYGKPDQQIVVQFIDMPINHHQRDDFIEFWRKYDIKTKLRPFITFQDDNTLNLEYDTEMKKINRLPCFWIMNALPVSADGYSLFCGTDYDGKGICGDLNKSSIEEIWNTTKKEHRRIHLAGEWDKLPLFCQECEDWRGGYAKYE